MEQFLRAVLPPPLEDNYYYAIIPVKKGMKHYRARTIPALAKKIKELGSAKKDVYYALARYLPPTKNEKTGRTSYRKREQVAAAKSLWWDIDLKEGSPYPSKKAAAEAVLRFCMKHSLPDPILVDSGGGLHIYWPLRTAVDRETWEKLAHRLRVLRKEDGIAVDPAREVDPASILRPPGSVNWKYDPPRLVRLLSVPSRVWGPEEWDAALPALPVEPAGAKGDSPNDDLSAGLYDDLPVDPNLMAEKCAAIRLVRDTGGDVEEPLWRATIGALKFCEDGHEKAHEWSRGSPKYDPEALEDRWERWPDAPPTCEYIKGLTDACEKCPHSVTTPVQLGRRPPKEAEDPKPQKVGPIEFPPLPKYYAYDEKSETTFRYVENKEGVRKVPVLRGRLHAVKRWRNEFDQHVIDYVLIRTEAGQPSVKTITLSAKNIGAGGSDLKKELGSHEVYPADTSNASLSSLTQYIRAEADRIRMSKKAKLRFSQFGWKPDGSFLHGTTLYTEDGEERKQSVEYEDRAEALDPKGSLDKWRESILFAFEHDLFHLQYALACSFGSILGPFLPSVYKGIPLALTGSGSGQGKTTACNFALTVWGDPHFLTVSSEGGATMRARSMLLSIYQNIPILFDEITHISSDDMSAMLYALANGMDRLRLTKQAELKEAMAWNLISFLTANTDLTGLLHNRRQNAEAEMMRLVEISMDAQAMERLNPLDVDARLEQAIGNAGTAASVFVPWVVRHKETVTELITKLTTKITQKRKIFNEPKFRFWRYQTVAAVAGAIIAKELDIVPFDTKRLLDWLSDQLNAREDYIETELCYTPEGQLNALIRSLQGHTAVTEKWVTEMGTKQEPIHPVRGEVYARWIIEHEKNNPLTGAILISVSYIKNWCNRHRVYYRGLVEELMKAGYIRGQVDNVNLCRGLVIPGTPESVLVIDASKLRMQNSTPTLVTSMGDLTANVEVKRRPGRPRKSET